jgi:uncharacterized protein YecE (DUF72 family)
MKFGKLADISQVQFELPSDPPANANLLSQLPKRTQAGRIYLGCTGWSMKEWVGEVYPKGTKAKDFLKAYGKQFNTIELNTTHYRIPNAAMVDKWYQETPADFRFCPKIPQSISHSRSIGLGTDLIPSFCQSISRLREKLGCCFMQMPPYFGLDRLQQLEAFLKAFPSEIPLAVEVRHESWFGEPNARDRLLNVLQSYQRSTVITDVAGRRDVAHMGLSNATAMVRFVGNGLHPTDYSRADEWIQRLKSWLQQGLYEVYFFPHEPDNMLAPQMAAYFAEQIKAHLPEVECRGPQLIEQQEEQGEQMRLF